MKVSKEDKVFVVKHINPKSHIAFDSRLQLKTDCNNRVFVDKLENFCSVLLADEYGRNGYEVALAVISHDNAARLLNHAVHDDCQLASLLLHVD